MAQALVPIFTAFGAGASTLATVSTVATVFDVIGSVASVIGAVGSFAASTAGAAAQVVAIPAAIAAEQNIAATATMNYEANAQAFDINAQIQENNARRIRIESSLNEDAQRRRAAQVLGKQRASLAQAGIGLGSGTALDVERSSSINAELDALTMRYEGETKAQGFLQDANMNRYQANVARQNAAAATKQGNLNSTATLLDGVGRYGGTSITDSFNNVVNSVSNVGKTVSKL